MRGSSIRKREPSAAPFDPDVDFTRCARPEDCAPGFTCSGDACVEALRGMFGFALWDQAQRRLLLARDRLGIKPLYYGWVDGALMFASELKALRDYPGFRGEIDRDSLALFLQHSYVPSPRSIYQGVYKLPAGSRLTISVGGDVPQPDAYWRLEDVAARGRADPCRGTEDEAIDRLDGLLRDAVGTKTWGSTFSSAWSRNFRAYLAKSAALS